MLPQDAMVITLIYFVEFVAAHQTALNCLLNANPARS